MKRLLATTLIITAMFMGARASAVTILNADHYWHVAGVGIGQAPFGSFAPGTLPAINTYWVPGTSLSLSTTIDLSGYELGTVQYQIAIDNDYTLTVNGLLIDSLAHDGYAAWGPLLPLANAVSGLNTLEVWANDRGVETYFAMRVVGDRVPDSGSTLALLGVVSAMIGMLGRKVRL